MTRLRYVNDLGNGHSGYEALFNFQLERNGFTSTPEEFSILVEAKTAGDDVYAALDWEEISR